MNEPHRQIAAPCGLVVGAILGVAGTFASSASLRGLLWGIDGVALVAAGVSLWAASLVMISVPAVMPLWVRVVASIAAVLFSVVAVQLFQGQPLDALSRPLPFFAYPLLAATMFGWAWAHYRPVV